MVSTRAAKSSSERAVAAAGALDRKRFTHDRAAATEHLEVRHASGARRDFLAGSGRRGGEGAQSGG